MAVSYEQMTLSAAEAKQVPGIEDHLFTWGPSENDWRYCIVQYINDKPVKVIATDGGEPEDQTLNRDWSWVVDELNTAYQQGCQDGSG